jgi:ABC-2 type transport system permease protein
MTDPTTPGSSPVTMVGAVVRLGLQQLLRSKRTIVFALLGLFPPVLSLLFALLRSIPRLHINATGFDFFSQLMLVFYLQFLLILVALFYGSALINSEVEDRTLTYLLLRPVRRPMLVLGKYITYLIVALGILLPSMGLSYLILELSDGLGGIARHFPYLLWDLGVMVLGAMAYGAFFMFLGTALKRPVMVGLFFTILWEWTITHVPGRFGKFTILHYLLSLFPHSTVQRGIQALFGSVTSRPLAILALVGITLAFLLLSMELFRRREFVLEQ